MTKLKTVVVKSVTDPSIAHAIRCQADIILAPNTFILEGIDCGQLPRQIPRQWVDPSPLLDILDDDCQVGLGPENTAQL